MVSNFGDKVGTEGWGNGSFARTITDRDERTVGDRGTDFLIQDGSALTPHRDHIGDAPESTQHGTLLPHLLQRHEAFTPAACCLHTLRIVCISRGAAMPLERALGRRRPSHRQGRQRSVVRRLLLRRLFRFDPGSEGPFPFGGFARFRLDRLAREQRLDKFLGRDDRVARRSSFSSGAYWAACGIGIDHCCRFARTGCGRGRDSGDSRREQRERRKGDRRHGGRRVKDVLLDARLQGKRQYRELRASGVSEPGTSKSLTSSLTCLSAQARNLRSTSRCRCSFP